MDFASEVGGLEKGGGDAPGDVVAVRVDDNFFAGFSEDRGEEVVGGGFAVGASGDDDFGVGFQVFQDIRLYF